MRLKKQISVHSVASGFGKANEFFRKFCDEKYAFEFKLFIFSTKGVSGVNRYAQK